MVDKLAKEEQKREIIKRRGMLKGREKMRDNLGLDMERDEDEVR